MLVKKLLIILSLILTFTSLSFAEIDKSMVNIEELSDYGLEYKLYDNSQIIKIENENNSIYMQVGNNTVLRDKEIKSFFINTAGVRLNGDIEVKRFPQKQEGNIYGPKELFYSLTYSTKKIGNSSIHRRDGQFVVHGFLDQCLCDPLQEFLAQSRVLGYGSVSRYDLLLDRLIDYGEILRPLDASDLLCGCDASCDKFDDLPVDIGYLIPKFCQIHSETPRIYRVTY